MNKKKKAILNVLLLAYARMYTVEMIEKRRSIIYVLKLLEVNGTVRITVPKTAFKKYPTAEGMIVKMFATLLRVDHKEVNESDIEASAAIIVEASEHTDVEEVKRLLVITIESNDLFFIKSINKSLPFNKLLMSVAA